MVMELKAREANLALGDLWLECRPGLALRGITEQVHDDGTLGNGFVNLEEVLTRHPAILLCVDPRLAILSHTNNNIQALISHVEGLRVTLRSIANNGHGVVLEVILDTG